MFEIFEQSFSKRLLVRYFLFPYTIRRMIPIKKFSFFRNSGSCENSSLLPDVYQFLKCVAATENGVQAFTQFQTISTFCEVIATRKTGTVHEFCEGILCNMFGLFVRR